MLSIYLILLAFYLLYLGLHINTKVDKRKVTQGALYLISFIIALSSFICFIINIIK